MGAETGPENGAGVTTPGKTAIPDSIAKQMPVRLAAFMNHDEDYPSGYLAGILKSVKTIAMAGANSIPAKFSYGVLRVLHETGHDMIPVNTKEAGGEIPGLKVLPALKDNDRPAEMVQVFRASPAHYGIVQEAIDMGTRVLWTRIGVRGDEAAKPAESARPKVVMNRCSKIELFPPFWKPLINQQI